MPTTPPTITALPTPVPQTSDPTNFDTRADAFLTALPDFGDEANDLASNVYANALEAEADATAAAAAQAAAEAAKTLALNASTLVATSASSHSVTAGSKTFTLAESGRTFAALHEIVAFRASDVSTRMYGSIDVGGVSGQNITCSFASEGIVGSGGPYTDWIIAHAGFFQTGATAAELWALTSAMIAVTPKAIKDANAYVALTDGATVTPNLQNGRRFTWSMGASRTLGNPTNCAPGDVIEILITHTASSNVLAVGTAWKRKGGLAVLSTTNGQKDKLTGVVETVDGSNVATLITYDVAQNPA